MPELAPKRPPLLSPRNARLLAIAFGVGLVLFLLLWLDQRNDNDFFKSGGPTTGSGEVESLPAPIPADVAGEDGNASGLRVPAEATRTTAPAGEQPRLVEPLPPPPAPAAPAAPRALADTDAVPINRPAPRYPAEALSRNIGGIVRVRATVAPDGSVERMEVAESSGNRFLDRAAMDAVRRWTFKPALRGGQPVSATVIVPLEFNPNG